MQKLSHLSFLVFLTIVSVAPIVSAQGPPDLMRMYTSEVMREGMKNQMKSSYRSMWNGKGTYMMLYGLSQNPDFQEALGVTKEQAEEFKKLGTSFHSNPEVAKTMQEMQSLQKPNDPFLEQANEETKQAFLAAQDKFGQLMMNDIHQGMERIFTTDQKRKMQEIEIATMELMPLMNPEMFEALDLSEGQKSEMEKIKSELQKEFDQVSNDMVDGVYASFDYLLKESQKAGLKASGMKEFEENMEKTAKKLEASGINYKSVTQEKMKTAEEFVKKFKFQMYDVLTDEQMDRLARLINNPPDYMKKIVARLKKNREARAKATTWVPSPDSWRPGDPIPQEYIQHRQARFPKRK